MRKHTLAAFSVAWVTLATVILYAQSPPVLSQPYAGAVIVSGTVAPGRSPVSIYDNSYPVQTKLGMSQSVDGSGNFAVSIKVPLILGHQIVAVDGSGASSAPMVVAPLPQGPAGPN